MLENLNMEPDGVKAIQTTLADLDACFLHGFIGGQHEILAALPSLFDGTPLYPRLQTSIQALAQNTFIEAHFVTLAAARSALQGTLYDLLRHHILSVLGRSATHATDNLSIAPTQTAPLLDSTREWLMELAIAGFARLEREAVTSFYPTLTQLRGNLATISHAALLTGFFHELINALPVKSTNDVPLMRWVDLWSRAMLGAVGLANPPTPVPASGILYPLGVELRQHARFASLVVYGVLKQGDFAQWVRQTWSSFKATAIQGNEIWLLFPKAQPLLEHLLQGKAMSLRDMPMLPDGDLLWDANAAESGKKFKPLDIALAYCGIGQSLIVSPASPLERHPVQLTEPIALTDYAIQEGQLHLKEGLVLALDARRAGLAAEELAGTTALLGLLHYDSGEWSIQPLLTNNPVGRFEFAGRAGVELLKKPPKTSTVSILQERASRLLRK
ncbi:MAG: hypothetical protein F9K46_00450 [Anaerolineae bacterium]|nr:MAG: hypothetical protein F9K46_00450 [Anaerolineae bacterium]